MFSKEIVTRFESKFVKGSEFDCWEFLGRPNAHGYGQLGVNSKILPAHRISYQIYVGKIAEGLHVLHRCDNPLCVNPSHLFLGTNLDNIKDKVSKGRQKPGSLGETCNLAKLTERQVREIRKRFIRINHNVSNTRQLAVEFGVSRDCILGIVTGKNWKHLH